MAKPGPAARPRHLKAIEGNPGHEPTKNLEGGLKLPPAVLTEPDWQQWFPKTSAVKVPRKRAKETAEQAIEREGLVALRSWELEENGRARADASVEWRRVKGTLSAQNLLADLDHAVLADYAVCWARLVQCERDVSAHGLRQRGERGWTRNGSITSAKAYRDQLRFYVGQLGLSPVARDGFTPDAGGAEDGDTVFDV